MHGVRVVFLEPPQSAALSRSNSFLETQRRAEETRSSAGIQQMLFDPSPPPTPPPVPGKSWKRLPVVPAQFYDVLIGMVHNFMTVLSE